MAEATAAAATLTEKLEQLKAAATKEYSLKNYEQAAEHFSEAAQVQDEINGEMAIENADLLYQYGRCLYHVAVSNSDVLGGKVANTEEPKRKKRKVTKAESSSAANENGEGSSLIADAIKDGEQKMAEEVVEAAVEEKDETKSFTASGSSNPYFQITGDENFTDSEEEEEEGGGEPEEQEEDDFQTAYEILDMARILLTRKLEAAQADNSSKGKGKDEKPETRQLKERLADTHDLQAEISLENERFEDAINDTREALNWKIQLYPEESSLVAEAHFKLSLALEFASVTSREEGPDGEAKVAAVDEEKREDAAAEMELAIASCRMRIAKEEASLASLEGEKAAELKKSIDDVKEMTGDMETRLEDLRKPATSLSAMQGPFGPAGAPGADQDPLRGVLGAMLGESKAEQQKRIDEATQNANDLSGMIKKKKPKQEVAAPAEEGTGKRKMEDEPAEFAQSGAINGNGKKVKFDEKSK
ncbi:NASP-related sim3 [Lecanosticta acicola]|uniref:NASP-related sim3 n=1 Tax=Lecanosticta acicola TaxID=111012 RepID=A0AAI9EDR9_9PEZI|nr:NASP-related sim3 [Lecanosticta acicola]